MEEYMEKYLFRGKSILDGTWHEGSLLVFPSGRTKILKWNQADLDFDQIEVEPETVGQYTGIKDKNGKKIFEGDIISIKFETDGVDGSSGYSWYESASVVFSEEKHAWIVVFDDGGEELYLNEYDDIDDVVVIANIYDNSKSANNLEITWDDLPEDIKELVEWGIYIKEEAIEKHKKYMNICRYCSDLDVLMEAVCYIPTDNGGAIDIPVNYCPVCGRKLDA